jgi:hypothetical protein
MTQVENTSLTQKKESNYPHVPAAFINSIAEEGTKEEAIYWLQEVYNEVWGLRARLKAIKEYLETTGPIYTTKEIERYLE